MKVYGLPQPLTGDETITIHQVQNGQFAKCTMHLSEFVAFISTNANSTSWATNLPTDRPSTAGVVWNDGGVVSIS